MLVMHRGAPTQPLRPLRSPYASPTQPLRLLRCPYPGPTPHSPSLRSQCHTQNHTVYGSRTVLLSGCIWLYIETPPHSATRPLTAPHATAPVQWCRTFNRKYLLSRALSGFQVWIWRFPKGLPTSSLHILQVSEAESQRITSCARLSASTHMNGAAGGVDDDRSTTVQ
jgi:hypothetical protein